MRPITRVTFAVALPAILVCLPVVATSAEDDGIAVPSDGTTGDPVFVLPDTIEIRAGEDTPESRPFSLLTRSRPRTYLGLQSWALTPTPPPTSILHPRKIELSRFACSMYGLDRGANLGLWLGGIGQFTGLWDEDTALYLMGAGAAVGALWGGTLGAEDPGFRIRIEADRH